MKCCIPPILEVPEGDFHCFDCSLKGATCQLEDYFSSFEKRRDQIIIELSDGDGINENQIGKFFLEEDLKHEYRNIGSERKLPPGLPISELDHSDPNVFLGKPIRLYCPNGNHYHSGRIIDVRPCFGSKDGEGEGEAKETTATADNATTGNKDTYCLVRFPAGKDHRKTPFVVWLRLEEHCVVVGMKLLWAQFLPYSKKDKRQSSSNGGGSGSKRWSRGILWSRSARELVCVMKEAQGTQILYDTSTVSGKNKSQQQQQQDNHKSREWGLVEDISRFGTDCYSVLRLEEDTRDSVSKQTQQQHDQECKVVSGVVQAELAEQARVRNWNKLPHRNTWHSDALCRRDEYTLGPLEYKFTPKLQIEPSPAIQQGLDRSYILKKLKGVQPTKDVASSLVCEL